MDTRFSNIFNLTEDQAIALLQTPLDDLEDKTDRYIAASHLVNFPSERTVNALIEAIHNPDPHLYNRITRRKAIESLGRLKANIALPVICSCLADDDIYTVENSVWAIGEIGTDDATILEEIAKLLEKPQQSYRVIIQTLANFNYLPALERIKPFIDSDNEPIASSAIAAVARFTGDYSQIDKVVAFLTHSSVNARRACIQDLIDAKYYDAIPQIARCAVSIVFRLRGIRLLADAGKEEGKLSFSQIEPFLDQVMRDHPNDLDLVHQYEEIPPTEFLIQELYNTDFGRCYLATKALIENYAETVEDEVIKSYNDEAHNDYGAHYHVIKLLGWLKSDAGYEIVVEALNNRRPQFQKSRSAAAIALANYGDKKAIPLIQEALNTKVWELKYACLMALKELGEGNLQSYLTDEDDWMVKEKGNLLA
ncbi:phycocyanin operon protein Y [Aphanothece hegewaldii CCALA 016]|uniref:Phycocyanin operon protein Y n=1 Tax=Aphanothece hegewaldii CCALA 016 TaxID=2107694 RepID=A0A2T1LYF1_9CHRO|nr:HEAT repeat domain-containing protein [Aphanothece hegewaldii]PSF37428.1 phycocyanin operon protein Y [Aphanothece hegewaldii CCALA 016]